MMPKGTEAILVSRNKIPMTINAVERFGLMELAKQRQALKESRGIRTQKVDKEISNVDLHYVGLKAEHAVAKLLGLEIDMKNTFVGDGGIDLHYRGITLDVKFTSGDFNVRANKKLIADVAILVNPLVSPVKYDGVYYDGTPDPYVVSKPKFAWANLLIVGYLSNREYHLLREWTKGSPDYWSVHSGYMNDMFTLKKYAEELGVKKQTDRIWGD